MSSDSVLLSDMLAQLAGGIVGGMLIIFTLGKLIEVLILKRFINSFSAMAWLSSIIVFTGLLLTWLTQMDNPDQMRALPPAKMLVIFAATLLLPTLRILFQNRRAAKPTTPLS